MAKRQRLTGTKMHGQIDHIAAKELFIFIQNDSVLYRQECAIDKNLRLKLKRGVFDKALAVKLFMYLADAGAIKYAKEYGSGKNDIFNRKTRFAVAAKLTRYWIDARRNEGMQINPRIVEYKTPPWPGAAQHTGPWKCTECGKIFKTDKSARNHKFNTGHSSFKSALKNPLSKKNARRIMAVAMSQAQKRGWIENPTCDQCQMVTIQGLPTHETGCPKSYRGSRRECKWCGQKFEPQNKIQKCCSEECERSYAGY